MIKYETVAPLLRSDERTTEMAVDRSNMSAWRNWQTRTFEGRMGNRAGSSPAADTIDIADVAELADAHGSGPCRVITPGGSSSLPVRTNYLERVVEKR
jgi:hypothetical protein